MILFISIFDEIYVIIFSLIFHTKEIACVRCMFSSKCFPSCDIGCIYDFLENIWENQVEMKVNTNLEAMQLIIMIMYF